MLWLIAGALGLSALSLLLPWAIAFDPWAWISWGRDITHLSLDTSDGPSWKPLPVVATTVFSLAGSAAPVLWLLVARAGGLLALAGAAVLANRLAGPLAGVIAAATMAVTNWWFFNTALGNSEPLFAAATLWAILAHLDGRPRLALWLAVAGGLMRPEAWPFIGLYVLWLWRTRGASVPELGSALGVLALLWFGPDVIGAGGALGASEAALGPGSALAASNADVPGLQVLIDFARMVTWPVLLAALVAAAIGDRVVQFLALGATAWVLLVAVMTQAGYTGNPRYNVPAAAICCVLAGVGVVLFCRRLGAGPALSLRPLIAFAVIAGAFLIAQDKLDHQLDELGRRADRREQLNALVDRAGGAAAIRACGAVRTIQEMKAPLAWRLDIGLPHMTDEPKPPGTVWRVSPGYFGEPAGPGDPGRLRGRRDRRRLAARGRLPRRPPPRLAERVGEHVRVALALGQLHRHQPRELRAAADVELAVDLAEVVLDRLRREEQRGRHLAVRHALRDEERDLQLVRRQPRAGRLRAPPRRRARRAQLRHRALAPRRRAEPLERRQRRPQRLARLGTRLRAPQALAVRELRPRELERHRQLGVDRERGLERLAEAVLRREHPAAAQRGRARPAAAGRLAPAARAPRAAPRPRPSAPPGRAPR